MPKQPSTITIRPLSGVDDALHLQTVHAQIWGVIPGEIVPAHIIITLAANGGMVLGAFDPAGPDESGGMVGFVLGWLGTTKEGALKHVSHIAGVLPAWRGRGIGMELKLAQRDFLLAQGLTTHVTWTYDPLQRINGAFNIHRLGATCATYKVNVYGTMTDELNKGMPSDRFQVDWHVDSPRVRHAITHGHIPLDWESSRPAPPARRPHPRPHPARGRFPPRRPPARQRQRPATGRSGSASWPGGSTCAQPCNKPSPPTTPWWTVWTWATIKAGTTS